MNMHKVVLISGSPRKGGNTMDMLKIVAEEIAATGIETEIISLSGKNIRACLACPECNKDGSCVIDDGSNEIFAKIEQADGLIVGSPVYFGTARGDLMNLLQRLGMYSFRHGHFLSGMVGGPVVVGRRGGHTATIQELLMFSFICGMTICGSNYWNIAFGRNKGEALDDSEAIATMRKFAQNVAQTIKKTRI
jgi:multimeric flavodoxin WrbA